MFDILNEMCELVYVVDINTYEMLFLNLQGRKTFGVCGGIEDQICYQLLQGRDSPCPFCPNNQLKEDEVYIWERTNPVVNRHYILKDKLIDWNKRAAKVEIAFDTTENENEKTALKNKLEAERLMMKCIHRLYRFQDLDAEINYIMQEIGMFLNAERTYIFEIRDHKMFNTYEWCGKGVKPQINNLQGLDEAQIECWKPYFSAQESYIMEDIEPLRECDPKAYQKLAARNIRSFVTVPLEQEGRLAGYIGVDNPSIKNLSDISLIFHTLRYFLMASIRRALDEERLKKLSYYDPLTGAFNRNRYIVDLEEQHRQDEAVGIVYLDINGLKDINDTMGHSCGDQVILNTARSVNGIFGESGRLYRVGGDEFIVLCSGCTREHFHDCILQLKKQLCTDQAGSAAIGYQWSEKSKNMQESISAADIMMYEDKKCYYRRTGATRRYRHYNDDVLELNNPGVLQQELNKGHFLVYLQPKISFQTRNLAGAEALVRYQASGDTLIGPDQILPMLEELHLISQIDFYVFDVICRQISDWSRKGYRLVPVSVNFSRDSISEMDFISRLIFICNKHKVDKRLLEIEITEGVESLEDFDLKSFSARMHEAGFLLSVDDFGIHYANLSLLTSIEFDKLMIDKSLIDTLMFNRKTQLVVKALSAMCLSMEIDTTVEGVETEKQFQILQEMGFQEAQGFLFSRPVPIRDFEIKYCRKV